MPSKSTNRNRLRTALETQRKWAAIFYRAFKRQAPFATEEYAPLGIMAVMGNASVIMPPYRSWVRDSALYAVETFNVEAILPHGIRVTVVIHLDKIGPKHDLTVESVYTMSWITDRGAHRSVPEKRDFIEQRVTEWAWEVLRREVAPRRINRFKEELMATAWAPARVERWLSAGLDVEAL